MKKNLSVVAIFVLAATLLPAAFAQQEQQGQSSQGNQGMSQSAPDQDSAQTPSSYTGTVMKSGGKFVLKTDVGTLQLDDQAKAKKYVGKQVTVSGTVDKTTGMLHVADIAPTPQQ
jgi:hypothetical protein